MASAKSTTPQSHQRVDGILFEARTAWNTVTVLGIPFEHLGRLWAVHLAIGESGLWSKWVVSDVETGTNVPGVSEPSPDLESLTKPINKSPADDGASQGEQSEMSLKRALETNAQLAEASKPGMGAFDHPAMLAEPVVLLDATASDPGSHAPLAQMPAASREVVSLIRVKLVGAASRAAIESGHARDGVNEHLEYHRVVTIGTGDHQRQRHAAPVYDEMALATELAAIRWIRPRLLAPRGLATVAPSTLARLQSIWSCSRRRLSRAKCSRSQTPLACQSRRRRQHVMPLPKPSSLGRSSHGIPVCRTNKMPFSAARSSTRGRPPLVEGSTTGSSGCNAFHSSLLIFFRAMPPTTLKVHGAMTWFC